MRELMRRTIVILASAGRTITAPRVVLCLLLAGGSTCAIVGVQMLAGTPAALLVAALLCFAIAYLILRGLDSNV